MAAGKETEENYYSGGGLGDYSVDDVLNRGNEDNGAEDMGPV